MRRKPGTEPITAAPTLAAADIPEPHSLVWCRVLQRHPGATRMQVAVSEAVVEFPRATVAAIAAKLDVDRSTVHRVMASPDWQRLHAAYLLERKDLCKDDFRRAMANATERIADAASRRALEGDEIQLLKLAGQYTGELSADTSVQVQVNQGAVLVADKVTKALAEVGLVPSVTVPTGDKPAQVPAVQPSTVE